MFQRFLKSSRSEAQGAQPRVNEEERLYVIGDVHGRSDLLLAMLEKVVSDAQLIADDRVARFILLGDYIDRGDHSADVLETLCAIDSENSFPFEFLMGNHEAAMLTFLEDPIGGADWLSWGGRQTLASYGINGVPREPGKSDLIEACDALHSKAAKHLDFLRGLKRYTTSGDVICAHASLDPSIPLEEQPDRALLWGQPPSGEPSGLEGKLLVHGHFASYEPVQKPGRICVDTGAYYSGRLTAVRLDNEMTFLNVDVMDIMP